jgi:mannose-6-phosphate isomerase-like protein (cupin superfamily)
MGQYREVVPPGQTATFGYRKDTLDAGRPKQVAKLCRTDLIKAEVQLVRQGGENNLHAHPHRDEIFWVLAGCVRFYGEGDVVLAELERNNGIVIPRAFPYWFESVGDEELEVLLVAAADSPVAPNEHFGGRTNHAAPVGGRAEERS